MSSAANNCLTLLTKLSIDANRVDTDQTAPKGADPDQTASSLIWVHTVCHRGFLNISADVKSRPLLLRFVLQELTLTSSSRSTLNTQNTMNRVQLRYTFVYSYLLKHGVYFMKNTQESLIYVPLIF